MSFVPARARLWRPAQDGDAAPRAVPRRRGGERESTEVLTLDVWMCSLRKKEVKVADDLARSAVATVEEDDDAPL